MVARRLTDTTFLTLCRQHANRTSRNDIQRHHTRVNNGLIVLTTIHLIHGRSSVKAFKRYQRQFPVDNQRFLSRHRSMPFISHRRFPRIHPAVHLRLLHVLDGHTGTHRLPDSLIIRLVAINRSRRNMVTARTPRRLFNRRRRKGELTQSLHVPRRTRTTFILASVLRNYRHTVRTRRLVVFTRRLTRAALNFVRR